MNKIALGSTYNMDRQDGDLIKFLKQVHTVCFGSDDRGLSLGRYKQVVSVKSMNKYINNKLHDPHGFKEEIKIKFDTLKAVVEKFPNRTGAMMELLKTEVPPVNWAGYYALPATD